MFTNCHIDENMRNGEIIIEIDELIAISVKKLVIRFKHSSERAINLKISKFRVFYFTNERTILYRMKHHWNEEDHFEF
jgi:hypothetical protein